MDDQSPTNKWTQRFLDLAHLVASWSKDPSTQVGAVAVTAGRQILSTGYNGFARGVRDYSDRMSRPAKYLWTLHAEANLVAHAGRHGINLQNATVYVTHYPCAQCAALLINSGIKAVVVDAGGTTNMPSEQFEVARSMFHEAGIPVTSINHVSALLQRLV